MGNKMWKAGLAVPACLAVLSACGNDQTEGANENSMEDELVIYSTHAEDMIEMVANAFEEETGVEVTYINLMGELAERVEAEMDNPQADIMFGGASNLFMDLKEKGAFTPTEPVWGESMDPMFKDEDGYWYGTIQTPVSLFYNTDMLSEDELPSDWSDLADDQYEDLLIFRNALSSSARVMYASLLQQYDQQGNLEEGWAFLNDLDANTKAYFDSGTLQMQAIGRQEAAISFSTMNHVLDNQINHDLPIEIIDLESGFPVITDAIAMIDGAPNPNAAEAFLEFAGSAEIQGMLAQEFNRMPTNEEALSLSPDWMQDITFNVMDVDWDHLAEHQADWMQTWDTDVKDSEKDVE
ncbi:extracellular solute-binding protein [Salisediminibacterium selenitireducens]|uniref:Extracellular solute-binding protein family 1 n=1 Tax=Bacillus selenitireducens (strain ATCC 700615 / DSM 15326 / MLS10) TaxID=439292 RepID=D6XXU7_BACIE|nr:extracellular solute-binding protein [Salisediminibacterium selenitireducens]ADI00140.1 extracellular solute-binding protein family 1 [[Bacillus] selenitireducens MLS10]